MCFMLFLFLLGRRCSKKRKASSFQIGSGTRGVIWQDWTDLQVGLLRIERSLSFDMTFTSYFQDGGNDVISRLPAACGISSSSPSAFKVSY